MKTALAVILLLCACDTAIGPVLPRPLVTVRMEAIGAPGCAFSWHARATDSVTTILVSLMELDSDGTNTIVPLPDGRSGGRSSLPFIGSSDLTWSQLRQSTLAIRWRLGLTDGQPLADDTLPFPACQMS